MRTRKWIVDCHRCPARLTVEAGYPGWATKKYLKAGWRQVQAAPNQMIFFWYCPKCADIRAQQLKTEQTNH